MYNMASRKSSVLVTELKHIDDDYVADNYRLEVITNPDDNKVIFWNLIGD